MLIKFSIIAAAKQVAGFHLITPFWRLRFKNLILMPILMSQDDNMARIIFISFVELNIWTDGVET